MRVPWSFLALLLAALGCREDACLHFEEIALVDRRELATPEQHQLVLDIVARFHAWTDRDSVCVSQIRFTDDIPSIIAKTPAPPILQKEHRTGFIQGDKIFLNPASQSLPSLERTTLHEFCHAFDFHVDLVVQRWDFFSRTPILFGDESHAELIPRERFAYLCELGAPAVAAANAGACHPERELLLVEKQVYGGYEYRYHFTDPVVRSKRVMTRLPSASALGRAWTGDGFVFVQRSELNDTLYFTPFAAFGAAGEVDRFGPTHAFPIGTEAYLLDANPNPPVLAPYGDAPELVPVRLSSSGTPSTLRYPTQVSQISHGVVVGDVALLSATLDGESGYYHRVDLQAGTVAPWPAPVEGGSLSRLVVADGLVAGIWAVESDLTLIAWQRLDTNWEMLAFPESLLPVDLAVDPHGNLFVRWFHLDFLIWGYASLSVTDLEPTWRLARAPCSDPDLGDGWGGSFLTVYEGALLDITQPVEGVSVVSEIDF